MFRSSSSLRKAAKSFISFITVRHPFEQDRDRDIDRQRQTKTETDKDRKYEIP